MLHLGGGSSQIMYAVGSEIANGAPDGYVRSMVGCAPLTVCPYCTWYA
jgi:hypothetical protein